MKTVHIPVLLQEIIQGLEVRDKEIVVDMTLGGSGHAKEILGDHKALTYIGLDANPKAIILGHETLDALAKKNKSQLILNEGYFDSLADVCKAEGIEKVNKVLFDLGLSSDELSESGKGFTFQKDEPLDMRYGVDTKNYQATAREIVNEWSEESIADIIYGYGEEKFSRRIARAIVQARTLAPIETTGQLVEIISSAIPFRLQRKSRLHPATRTFQALRIAVNDELGRLSRALHDAFDLLAPDGRIAVISFHSLEDRIVKRFFQEKARDDQAELIVKKPIRATPEEISRNPRSRSALLRIIKKK